MDSFYDAPRRPPPQISKEKLSGEPMVPEISLLVPPNMPQNKFTPYSQWKRQQMNQNELFVQNKENIANNISNSIQNNSILKKVRFENAQLAQAQDNNRNADCILGEHNINKAKVAVPFEQMYMANIPSRQLDLSVIDIPKKPAIPSLDSQTQHIETKSRELPKTYREFLQTQEKSHESKKSVSDDTVTDIFNYKRNIPVNKNPIRNDTSMDIFKTDKFVMKSTPDKVNHIHDMLSSSDQDHVGSNFVSQKKQLPQKENVTKVDKYFYELGDVIHKESSFTTSQRDDIYSSDKLSQNNIPDLNHQFKNFFLGIKNNSDNTQRIQSCNSIERKLECDFSPALTPETHNNKDVHCKCHFCLKSSGKNDDNLSTKDLLKIISQQSQQIAQQNNQLMLLQQQVSELVSIHKNYEKDRQNFMLRASQNEDVIKCVERQPCCQRVYHEQVADRGNVQERYVTSTQRNVGEPDFFDLAKMNRHQRPNFSIGLTTSVEVSFRRPMTEAESKNNNMVNYDYQSPKIQEITETESSQSDVASDNRRTNSCEKSSFRETLIDTSLVFKEPIKVRETCPSPEPSININMNDFEDTDSEDDSSQIGATFYGNLMAQVNKVLQKAQIDSMENIVAYESPGSCLNNKTMHKVKQTTLKHLKRIGVNLPNDENIYNDSLPEESAGVSYTQEDVSFAVKQLLMKYLPSDHLAKLASKKELNKDKLDLTPKQNIGAIKSRPEFSFASVQYMKKYNLIANSQKEFPGARRQANSQSPKILDISKLKQQPKLL